MPDTLTPQELDEIRARDTASYWSTEDDPDHAPPYLMSEEGHSYTLEDRRALLAHIDALTAAVRVEGDGIRLGGRHLSGYWEGHNDGIDKMEAAVLAILKGEDA